jgi:hypothetical protein
MYHKFNMTNFFFDSALFYATKHSLNLIPKRTPHAEPQRHIPSLRVDTVLPHAGMRACLPRTAPPPTSALTPASAPIRGRGQCPNPATNAQPQSPAPPTHPLRLQDPLP